MPGLSLSIGLGLGSGGVGGGNDGPPAVLWEDLTGDVSAPGNGVLLWSGDTSPSGARVATPLDPADFDVRWIATSAAVSDSVFVGLSESLPDNYDPLDEELRVAVATTSFGRLFYGSQENNLSIAGDIEANYPEYYRITPVGNDILFQRSDDQASWTDIVTLDNVLGANPLYIYCYNSGPANNDTIQVWAGTLS